MDTDAAYATLGLPPFSSIDQVKLQYRKFALMYHPDRVSIDHKKAAHDHFARISTAYELLTGRNAQTIDPPQILYSTTFANPYSLLRSYPRTQANQVMLNPLPYLPSTEDEKSNKRIFSDANIESNQDDDESQCWNSASKRLRMINTPPEKNPEFVSEPIPFDVRYSIKRDCWSMNNLSWEDKFPSKRRRTIASLCI
jgi:DnaJ domain